MTQCKKLSHCEIWKSQMYADFLLFIGRLFTSNESVNYKSQRKQILSSINNLGTEYELLHKQNWLKIDQIRNMMTTQAEKYIVDTLNFFVWTSLLSYSLNKGYVVVNIFDYLINH